MGLVRSVARRYRDLGLPLEDLTQEGAIGLLEAIDAFDPRNGAAFSTYAFWRIRQSITHALTDHGRLLRLPKGILERRRAILAARAALVNAGRTPTASALADATGLSAAEVVEAVDAPASVASLDALLPDGRPLETAIPDPAATDPETAAFSHLEHERLGEALARLPARKRAVIGAHFGLDGEPSTLAEVGAALEVSSSRAHALERDALDELALALEPALTDG